MLALMHCPGSSIGRAIGCYVAAYMQPRYL